jgi:hypothetical protein
MDRKSIAFPAGSAGSMVNGVKSGRVALIPSGPAAAFGGRVAIGWRDATRAPKAGLPALHCLGGADLPVLMPH